MIDILLIEDDDAHAKIVQRYLGVIPDYTIHRCRTLQEGLASVKKNKYTVLLLDLSLPDSTFQETFKKIEETAKRFPVVVLTSLDEQRFAQKLLKLGAQDYLSKGSLSSENLNRSIRYAIERKSLQQKLRMYSKALEKKNDHLEKMVSERTEKLSKSEKKYRSLVQLSPISILIMNSEGQLCYANPEFQRRFGYKRDNNLSTFFFLFADTENSLNQAFKDQLKQKLFKPI